MMDNYASTTIGSMAIATGVVGILALLFLVLFFSVGEPFGTLNDFSNGVFAITSAVLAWMLHAEYHAKSPLSSQVALLFALIGAVIAVIGSVLVIFKFTGWVLAGFYTGLGNALMGVWLAMFCYTFLREGPYPSKLMVVGILTGILMAFGLFSLLGIISRIDSAGSMPWYLNIAYIGYLGSFLYLVWPIWLGRVLLAR